MEVADRENCREWKLSAINPPDRHTWRSGVRSAMCAASQSDYDYDDDMQSYQLYSCFIYRHIQAFFLYQNKSYIFPLLGLAKIEYKSLYYIVQEIYCIIHQISFFVFSAV